MVTKIKVGELGTLNEESIRGRMKEQRADRDYLVSHYNNLIKKYPNHWVVISGGKLILSENDPDKLLETLSKTRKDDMLIYYLADPEDIMLLESL
ncbi:DUF5678 domain-containing protein [Chloroflexota bacterium]